VTRLLKGYINITGVADFSGSEFMNRLCRENKRLAGLK
jgi:hypothetical protein